eukprot:m.522080 g.522080  ORF g.522080 m.522080 type:complete len:122 (-) comp57509_c0_seq1:199-564(-)
MFRVLTPLQRRPAISQSSRAPLVTIRQWISRAWASSWTSNSILLALGSQISRRPSITKALLLTIALQYSRGVVTYVLSRLSLYFFFFFFFLVVFSCVSGWGCLAFFVLQGLLLLCHALRCL